MRWFHRHFLKHAIAAEVYYHRGLAGAETLVGAVFTCSCGEKWFKRF